MLLDARQASARRRPVSPMPRPATGSSTPRAGRPVASHLPFSGLPRRSCRPHLARLPASLSHSLPRLSLTRVRRALALLPRRRRPPWPSPAPPSRAEPLLARQKSRSAPWPPPPPSSPWSSLLRPPSAQSDPPTSFPALHRCSRRPDPRRPPSPVRRCAPPPRPSGHGHRGQHASGRLPPIRDRGELRRIALILPDPFPDLPWPTPRRNELAIAAQAAAPLPAPYRPPPTPALASNRP